MATETVDKDFYWGAATAAYQVEGGNDNTDWARAARDGRVPPAGRLADHYHRYEADFDLAQQLGHNAHRFSVEWARVEPVEGEWNHEAFAHYRAVLEALRARGLEPFITLWHFTLPDWFAARGGFERADAPRLFARYCALVVKELGDLCTHFATINEPNVWASHGWLFGAWPPFKRGRVLGKVLGKDDGSTKRVKATARHTNVWRYFLVERRLIAAHIAAWEAIKKERPNALVSVVKHVHWFTADRRWRNRLRARLMQYLQSGRYLNRVSRYLDEISLNYYRATTFGDNKSYLKTDMGWDARPDGIYGALLSVKKYGKPVFVAEAGVADATDALRARYITIQVKSMLRAKAAGVNVRGHLYWSLIDNYEWAEGVEKRFGLVHVNYQTLTRTIRPSALVYKQLIETHTKR